RVSWRGDSAPLGIPDIKALHVKLSGLLVGVHRGDALYHELLLRDESLAGIAPFSVASTTPESRHAVIRQTAIVELTSDEETKIFGCHWSPPSGSAAGNTPDSRRLDASGSPTHDEVPTVMHHFRGLRRAVHRRMDPLRFECLVRIAQVF